MKRILSIASLLLCMVVSFVFLVFITFDEQEEIHITEPIPFTIETKPLIVKNIKKEQDPIETATQKMQQEMIDIESIKDKKEWFLAYKDIIFRYSKWFDPPETVFDVFTEDEVRLICQVVETETYDQDFISKVNVANVVFNRYYSGDFGETIEEVVTTPNQFAYFREEITEDTILAIMYSYEIEDTTNGCIAFRSGHKPEKWYTTDTQYWTKQFEDNSGHAFYK